MKILAKQNRELIMINAKNTQNENDAEKILLQVPEQYEDFNKKIVFVTPDGNVWDIITNNEYLIKKAITKYNQVDFYIWLTKDDVDFRSQTKTLKFYHNVDASDEITDEEIGRVNTVINILEEEITKVDGLETELNEIIEDLQHKLDTDYFKGDKGDDGESAYQIWLDEGNVGTEQDFLDSLKGEKGEDGENGTDGHDGVDGQDGQDGHTPVKYVDYWNTQDKQEIVTDVETALQPTITAIQNTADTAERIARGANQSLSFSNYQAMITAFNSLANNVYSTGQNVMIITLNVPDLWISSIESTSQTYTYTTDEAFTTALNTNGYVQVGYYRLSALETQKVDLTNYYTKSQADTLLGAKVNKSSFVYDSNTETLSITMS